MELPPGVTIALNLDEAKEDSKATALSWMPATTNSKVQTGNRQNTKQSGLTIKNSKGNAIRRKHLSLAKKYHKLEEPFHIKIVR